MKGMRVLRGAVRAAVLVGCFASTGAAKADEINLPVSPGTFHSLSIGAGGALVATTSPVLQVLNASTGRVVFVKPSVAVAEGEPHKARVAAISPNGQVLAYLRNTFDDNYAELVLASLPTGQVLHRITIYRAGDHLQFRDNTSLYGFSDGSLVEVLATGGAWNLTNRRWSLPTRGSHNFFHGIRVLRSVPYFINATESGIAVYSLDNPSDTPVRVFPVQGGHVSTSVGSPERFSVFSLAGHAVVTADGSPSNWPLVRFELPNGYEPTYIAQGPSTEVGVTSNGTVVGIFDGPESKHYLLEQRADGSIVQSRTISNFDASTFGEGKAAWLEGLHVPKLRMGPLTNLASATTLLGTGKNTQLKLSQNGQHLLGIHGEWFQGFGLHLWDAMTGVQRAALTFPPQTLIGSIEVANNGWVVTGGGRLRVLNAQFQEVWSRNGKTSDVAISPVPIGNHGYVIVVAPNDQTPMMVLRLTDGVVLRRLNVFLGSDGGEWIRFSPDGRFMSVAGLIFRTSDWALVPREGQYSSFAGVWVSNTRLYNGWFQDFDGTKFVDRPFEYSFSFSELFSPRNTVATPDGTLLYSPRGQDLLAGAVTPGYMPYRILGFLDLPSVPHEFNLTGEVQITPDGQYLWVSHSNGFTRRVRVPWTQVGPAPSALVAPARVRGVGTIGRATIRIPFAFSTPGSRVYLQSLTPTRLNVMAPDEVIWKPGETSRTFDFTVASAPSQPERVTLRGITEGGLLTREVLVEPTIAPAPARVAAVPDPMYQAGSEGQVTVTLARGAFLGGDQVTLTSSNPALLSVLGNGTVQVPADSQTAGFRIALRHSVPASTRVVLTATTTGGRASAIVTVVPAPPSVRSVTVTPSALRGVGSTATVRVALMGVAPTGGIALTLASSDPALVEVVRPATVTVPAGRSSWDFQVRVVRAPSRDTTVSVTARTLAGEATGRLLVRPDLPPPPSSVAALPASLRTVGSTSVVTVTLRSAATGAGAAVTLASGAPSIVAIVGASTVTVPAGRNTARFTVRLLRRVTTSTSVVLTARTSTGSAAGRITAIP